MAIKVTDIDKIDLNEIGKSFGAKRIDFMKYTVESDSQLNEIIFEFDINHKVAFDAYLKECQVTGRSYFR